jgi:sulfur relay (sulfurtransferase) DsrF/TusC family protein
MQRYLIIESRDPFESPGFAWQSELASSLAATEEVTVFLLENAVLAARAGARFIEFERLRRAGVRVIVDEFALRERGIAASQLAAEVEAVRIDALVAELGRGAKAIWC